MVKYIIRLDDACPTMNWKKWNRMFDLLDKYDINPIVAVIPNNQDNKLKIDPPNSDFWETVKTWQQKGYQIAMHGYDHVYISEKKGLVPLNSRSEFAGVEKSKQEEKIKKSWEIFVKNGITPNIWVAPAHSFDKNTLLCLKKHTDINIISDGVALEPFNKYGFLWAPQQLWKPKQKSYGIWTICYHPNTMNDENFNQLKEFLIKNYQYFSTSIGQMVTKYDNRKRNFYDIFFYIKFFIIKKIKEIYSKV